MPELRKMIRFIGSCLENETSVLFRQRCLRGCTSSLKLSAHLRSFEVTFAGIGEKLFEMYFRTFSEFIEECRKGRWIETHNYSAGAGGHGAQRYLPIGLSLFMSITKQTFIGPSETAHILGDAFFALDNFRSSLSSETTVGIAL